MSVRWLVIGLGNPLYGDEAAGLEVVKRLPAQEQRRAILGGMGGMALLHFALEAPKVTIVDAIEAGLAPGEIVYLAREDVAAFLDEKGLKKGEGGHSSAVFLKSLLLMAPEKKVSLLGIQIKNKAPGHQGLSPEVSQGVTKALRLLEQESEIAAS